MYLNAGLLAKIYCNLHTEDPPTGQIKASCGCLGRRANAVLVTKLHVAVNASHAAFFFHSS
jgi:hypothetical protein